MSTPTIRSGVTDRRRKYILIALASLKITVLVTIVGVFSLHTAIARSSERRLYSDIHQIPENHVGLLLGTAKYQPGGGLNPYFTRRIDAAVQLFETGKVRYIIASGDNQYLSYNEPIQMRQALIERGVPAEYIVLDYAGFSTLDSVVRTAEVFGHSSFTVISQRFHNERAIYIGTHFGYDLIGYNAEDIAPPAGVQTRFREYLARTKAVVDLHITQRKPRFLGEPVIIPDT